MSAPPFSQTYAEARAKFLAAAGAAGLDNQPHIHPLLGRDGETLALDVVRDGPADAPAVLVISSACHGVEGFCGSGLQTTLLADAGLRRQAHAQGVALLYLHGLNPYGFSWWRRTTHENVDLNRNFQDFSQPLPRNAAYDDIAHLLVPALWPPTAAVQQDMRDWIARHGLQAWQAAVTAGQYHHPEGLFYGGHNPTWSQQTLRHVLQDHGRLCARMGWIDLHTGLGPSGVGERIYAGRDEPTAITRARAWWGGPDGSAITSIYDGSSTSARLTGLMWEAAPQECPQAEHTGMALEYGTVPITAVLDALRADQWAENHPELPAGQLLQIKRQIRDAFYTDTDSWKQQVLVQAPATMQCTGAWPALVQQIGRGGFWPAVLDVCQSLTGASAVSLLHWAPGQAPVLLAAASRQADAARVAGERYLAQQHHRLDHQVQAPALAPGQIGLCRQQAAQLPSAQWRRDCYEAVGLASRMSLLMHAEGGGCTVLNAYRPADAGMGDDQALAGLGAQAALLAATLQRHLELVSTEPADPLATLSQRERQVVQAILAGHSAKQAGRTLGLSPTSVATYRQRAFAKLGVRRQVELFGLLSRRC